MSEGKVISFINMKGGVGKTTLSIGIADYLAQDKEEPTLFIDIDPQFNGTQGLLDYYKKDETIELIAQKEGLNKKDVRNQLDEYEYNFYTDKIKSSQKTIQKLFKSQTEVTQAPSIPKADEVITSLTDNLDILCGDLNLILANKSADAALIMKVKNFINENQLKQIYKYIIIDCPPTLTVYTDSALVASDYYVIPNRLDRYSITGIDSLQSSVSGLINSYALSLKCLGIIYTIVPKDIGVKQTRIKNSFENQKAVNDLDIFDAQFHTNNDIQVGITGGTLPTKYSSSKDDIIAITEELIQRIKDNDREG